MRFTLHTRGSKPLFITAEHLRRVEAALSNGSSHVSIPVLNDESGKMHQAIIPTSAIEQILSPGQDPSTDVLRFYQGEQRLAVFDDGSRFVGILGNERGYWWLEWSQRRFLFPVSKLAALRSVPGDVTADMVNTGETRANFAAYLSPELEEAADVGHEAGRGQDLLILVNTFDELSATELALAFTVGFSFGGAARARIIGRPALSAALDLCDSPCETEITFTLADAANSSAKRLYLIVDQDVSQPAEELAKRTGRTLRAVQRIGKPAFRVG